MFLPAHRFGNGPRRRLDVGRRICQGFGDFAVSFQVLHGLPEPYRAAAIPGYDNARAALAELGMLTTGISGSGPTLFSVTDDLAIANAAKAWLEAHYLTEAGGFAHVCHLDEQGTRRVD